MISGREGRNEGNVIINTIIRAGRDTWKEAKRKGKEPPCSDPIRIFQRSQISDFSGMIVPHRPQSSTLSVLY